MLGALGDTFEADASTDVVGNFGSVCSAWRPRDEETNLCGLDNQGSTCYLNSLLQSFFMLPELRDSLLSLTKSELDFDEYLAHQQKESAKPPSDAFSAVNDDDVAQLQAMGFTRGQALLAASKYPSPEQRFEALFDGSITTEDAEAFEKKYDAHFSEKTPKKRFRKVPIELLRLFAQLALLDKRSTSTRELTDAFNWKNNEAGVQHDVHELSRILLDVLHRQLRDSSQSNLVPGLFGGKLSRRTRCLHCGRESRHAEDFLDLPVVVENLATLERSLRESVRPELLEGSNRYHCEQCDERRDAQRGVVFEEMPQVLQLNLCRFVWSRSKGDRVKLKSEFAFPYEFPASWLNPCEESQFDGAKNLTGKYELHAIVLHSGTAHAGHYHALVKAPSGQWYDFNDASVTRADDKEIRKSFGGNDCAYVLYYRLAQEKPAQGASYLDTLTKKKSVPEEARPENLSDVRVPAFLRADVARKMDTLAEEKEAYETAQAQTVWDVVSDRHFTSNDDLDVAVWNGESEQVDVDLRWTVAELKQHLPFEGEVYRVKVQRHSGNVALLLRSVADETAQLRELKLPRYEQDIVYLVTNDTALVELLKRGDKRLVATRDLTSLEPSKFDSCDADTLDFVSSVLRPMPLHEVEQRKDEQREQTRVVCVDLDDRECPIVTVVNPPSSSEFWFVRADVTDGELLKLITRVVARVSLTVLHVPPPVTEEEVTEEAEEATEEATDHAAEAAEVTEDESVRAEDQEEEEAEDVDEWSRKWRNFAVVPAAFDESLVTLTRVDTCLELPVSTLLSRADFAGHRLRILTKQGSPLLFGNESDFLRVRVLQFDPHKRRTKSVLRSDKAALKKQGISAHSAVLLERAPLEEQNAGKMAMMLRVMPALVQEEQQQLTFVDTQFCDGNRPRGVTLLQHVRRLLQQQQQTDQVGEGEQEDKQLVVAKWHDARKQWLPVTCADTNLRAAPLKLRQNAIVAYRTSPLLPQDEVQLWQPLSVRPKDTAATRDRMPRAKGAKARVEHALVIDDDGWGDFQ
ncbi:MAG: hypothetical protein MHM6MM_000373 [Cercozoa sp. M6MM]